MSKTSDRARLVQLPIIPVVARWIRDHPGTVSLGQGVAGYAPPETASTEMERLKAMPLLHRYQAAEGLPELVEALGRKLADFNGVRLGPERRLMVTVGANAAFQQVILALCDPGDEVILPLPYYFNQEMALMLASARPVLVRSEENHLPDVEAIERAITPRTRAVVTVSPNNPTGAVYPEERLRAINTLCARRGLYHISDETYESFTFGGARHVSPAGFAGAESTTIGLFSFSKAYGFASWRIGYAVFPEALSDAMRKIQDTVVICPPVVSQLAALGCLKAGKDWLGERLAEVGRTRERVLAGLQAIGDLAEVGPSEGAFYVFLRLRRSMDSLEVARRLIVEHGVAVIPGTAFGMTDVASFRVAYGALTPETAEEGLGRLVRGLRALCR